MNNKLLFSHIQPRRNFLLHSLKASAGLALFSPDLSWGKTSNTIKKTWTVQQVMDLVMKDGNLSPISDTVDTLKSGKAGQTVTGIVTTMFATVAVIKEAAKRNANFIIAHEPTFYNHLDKPDWVKNNQVVKKKQELLEKHQIAVWRFHDYCHSLKPDAVSYGVAKKANWLSYYKTGSEVLTIPSVALGDLVKHLKKSLDIKQLRVIGELDQPCAKVVLMPGAWGGTRHVAKVEAENPDVLIVGEVSEWETAEYIRDSRLLGGKTALIILGHSVSEEPGMEYFAEWLQPKLSDLKVTHIASEDPFKWL
ncbi:Nif3-like dinuclear metal center hexameric protein [Dyadobacter pollutisoli]|jgi:putative NIF3 family GTP cyclohydrolase 1 type 2|uniref:Nif3-like dinuclear metal center hexameric protein n=1 Tax=Dyadobacter pollutisoli TaxID=2910158 RepID=A0A9E8NBL4_9BACT|nr:Nif3-like dinuclear metal center hexameric protein [Dyadobacter pollutisoli]WAC13580.1 Nif3-like dinuclear metal center hexameric protein [Dyadobacter pollutisoli]